MCICKCRQLISSCKCTIFMKLVNRAPAICLTDNELLKVLIDRNSCLFGNLLFCGCNTPPATNEQHHWKPPQGLLSEIFRLAEMRDWPNFDRNVLQQELRQCVTNCLTYNVWQCKVLIDLLCHSWQQIEIWELRSETDIIALCGHTMHKSVDHMMWSSLAGNGHYQATCWGQVFCTGCRS